MAVSFTKQIERWTEKASKKLEKVSSDAVIALFRDVTLRSPIGDPTLWKNPAPAGYVPGTFINSWNTSAGGSSRPVVRQPDTFARDTFAQIQSVVPGGIGKIIRFGNNTRYGLPLEFGHSTQAPAGMVRVAARNWTGFVKKAIASNR